VAEPHEIVWSEATRLLTRQEAGLDTLRVRALGVLTAGGLITGVLGAQKDSALWATLVALACLAASAGLAVWIHRPIEVNFSHDLGPMIQRVENSDREALSSLDVAFNWAHDLDEYRKDNAPKIARLVTVYSWMCALLGVEILASVTAVALAR
jgi:hypothetical protein